MSILDATEMNNRLTDWRSFPPDKRAARQAFALYERGWDDHDAGRRMLYTTGRYAEGYNDAARTHEERMLEGLDDGLTEAGEGDHAVRDLRR